MKYLFVKDLDQILSLIALILVGISSYWIGSIVQKESELAEIMIIYPTEIAFTTRPSVAPSQTATSAETSNQPISKAKLIASKNGSRYYYSHCSGINRIKPENRIYFDTPEQAEAQGLSLAANCQKL